MPLDQKAITRAESSKEEALFGKIGETIGDMRRVGAQLEGLILRYFELQNQAQSEHGMQATAQFSPGVEGAIAAVQKTTPMEVSDTH